MSEPPDPLGDDSTGAAHSIELTDRQRAVQRLLGRCMLRIQQYERLLKVILAQHELAGPADSLEMQRSARLERYSDKTLGTLVKALFETYLVKEGFERDLLPAETTPTDRISMAFSIRLSMTPELWAQTRTAIEELVDVRNVLVHHFIEYFDVWTLDGCSKAAKHLEGCYARIDKHLAELTEWAKSTDDVRAMAAQFAQTPAFLDLVFDGIAPDGSFEWSTSGIARTLRSASRLLEVEGWAPLDGARAWIAEHHPDQTPQKYGCKSWGQVLNDSRLFETQYRIGGDGRKSAWFRMRR